VKNGAPYISMAKRANSSCRLGQEIYVGQTLRDLPYPLVLISRALTQSGADHDSSHAVRGHPAGCRRRCSARSPTPGRSRRRRLQRQDTQADRVSQSVNPVEGCAFRLRWHADGARREFLRGQRDGSTLAVGALTKTAPQRHQRQPERSLSLQLGAVYVFTRKGGSVAQQAYVKASSPGDGANFGSSVVLSRDGNTMAVASYYETSAATGINGNQNDHSIRRQAPSTSLLAPVRLVAAGLYQGVRTGQRRCRPKPAEGDQFGYSIALSADGNTLAVGAIGEDSNATGVDGNQADNSANQSGAEYVFTRTGTTWSQQAYIKSTMTRANVLFGYQRTQRRRQHARVAEYDADRGRARVRAHAHRSVCRTRRASRLTTRAAGFPRVFDGISDDGNTIASGAADEIA